MPVFFEQVEGEIASVMVEGAYNGEPVYQAIAARQPRAPPSIVVPPRRSAALRPTRTRASETVTSASFRSKAAQRGEKRRATVGAAWLRRQSAATRP